jgi:hypothetical protein
VDRSISDTEIQYLLEHLDSLYTGTPLSQYLTVGSESKFFIPLSESPLDQSSMISIDKIPVLFPCSDQKRWYSEEGKRVFFHHDILKSAFYLLSGYQEFHCDEPDLYKRYSWKSSIQYKLGITQKPVVNYYFEVILEAFERYCQLNGLEFKRKTRDAPILFLSHDVDRIKKYSLRNLVYSILQLMGIKSRSLDFHAQVRAIRDYARGILLFRKDPYWNFQDMISLEDELKISSTWFFLEKTKMDNSRYRFNDRRIRDLISTLSGKGHEIALHGTLESSEDLLAMKSSVRSLNGSLGSPVKGIRQHFLKFNNPLTPNIQVQAGFDYDATLGFAEQTGFRNSYAYPFRLFDFENSKAMDIWQLPLNVMDATFFEYLVVPLASIPEATQAILDEVIRFNGVFSLLWHNCRLDEEWMPGVNAVYQSLIAEIMQSGFISLTGHQVIEKFRSYGASNRNSLT